MPHASDPLIDAVVIGRNEGARLMACLASLQGRIRRIVYVDSGSHDGSVDAAKGFGAQVIALDMTQPFTAARARNAGLAALDAPDFVQMVDGDCVTDREWISAALATFGQHPDAVVVCGRRREKFPGASVYNRLIDQEWDTPLGSVAACGGDALIRFAPLMAVGGYREDLIAGEEPELCLRLRAAAGQIWRIDAEMTLHDAAITRFRQWWNRSRRAGYAFAEGASLHGHGPDRHWVKETRRAVIWGLALPVGIAGLALLNPAALLLAAIFPLQIWRLARRRGWRWAGFSVLGKCAEAQGVVEFWLGKLRGKKHRLIEYK